VALITGGGSGIGPRDRAPLRRRGAPRCRNRAHCANLEETLTTMPATSARSLAIVADVADSASVRELFAAIDRDVGALDILVNNAGIGIEDMASFNETVAARGREASGRRPVTTPWNITQDMSDDTWRRMLSVHLDGTFFCTREAIPRMVKAKRGSIINVSSTAAFAGQEGAPHYSAAKAACWASHARSRASWRRRT
jgi:3-oxoacyl-[acyl-carrier protein] reductase